ncbi:MAG: hypothetical protein V3G53_04975 [Candidatus Enteromonas sp.]
MSKNKKKKQSRMSASTKENLKLGASAIISNAAVVELGQKKPWYGAIITALLSVVLAALPILTTSLKTKGGDILNGTTYGYETGLVHFQQDLYASGKKVDWNVENDSLAVSTVSGWKEFLTTESSGSIDTEPWYHHVSNVTKKVDFAVFVAFDSETETLLEGKDFSDYVAKVYNGINPTTGAKIGTTLNVNVGTPSSESTETTSEKNHVNTIIFGKNTFRVMKAKANGEWAEEASVGSLRDYSGGELPLNSLVKNVSDEPDAVETYIADTKKAWSNYLDKAAEKQIIGSAWKMTGLMAAIFVFFVFFMGLMIFIMTRGKNNPYRIYTFWMTQKMSYWAAFTPALLGMIIGFFVNATILQFLFIILFGFRIMWLSMKTLRPQA